MSDNILSPGLDALFGVGTKKPMSHDASHVVEIELNRLTPRADQPRKNFSAPELNELALSIKENGIIQPLLVKQGTYEIIAGERRWRAAKLAGLTKIPVIFRELNEQTIQVYSLIENIQRQALTPLEEANAYNKMINDFKLMHDDIAKRVGKSRVTITNLLRLLKLTAPVKQALDSNLIQMGHARTLLSLSDELQQQALNIIVEKQYSVRQAEKLVKGFLFNRDDQVRQDYKDSEKQYTAQVQAYWPSGAKVTFSSQDRGSINLKFISKKELEKIMRLLETNLR